MPWHTAESGTILMCGLRNVRTPHMPFIELAWGHGLFDRIDLVISSPDRMSIRWCARWLPGLSVTTMMTSRSTDNWHSWNYPQSFRSNYESYWLIGRGYGQDFWGISWLSCYWMPA